VRGIYVVANQFPRTSSPEYILRF